MKLWERLVDSRHWRRYVRTLPVVAAVILAGCGAAGTGSGSTAPRVTFEEPKDGQTVSSLVKVKLHVDNFTVEPAGPVKAGHGHLHITVDTDCVVAGQVIPKDDRHIHYGKGQTEADLQLAPGQHRLCLQAADGAHVALGGDGMRQSITITVE